MKRTTKRCININTNLDPLLNWNQNLIKSKWCQISTNYAKFSLPIHFHCNIQYTTWDKCNYTKLMYIWYLLIKWTGRYYGLLFSTFELFFFVVFFRPFSMLLVFTSFFVVARWGGISRKYFSSFYFDKFLLSLPPLVWIHIAPSPVSRKSLAGLWRHKEVIYSPPSLLPLFPSACYGRL